MKYKLALFTLIFLGCLFYSNSILAQQNSRSLSEFKKTEFVPTMEHEIHANKNAIFSPTLEYAWNELQSVTKGPIQVDSLYRDLYLLNRAKDFENSLLKSDYVTSAEIVGSLIRVKAEFKKSLPLFRPLASYDNELIFQEKKVMAFGGAEPSAAGVSYYKDDDNFIVNLVLENPWHEILLFKTGSKFHSLREALNELQENIKAGEQEMHSGDNTWKFDLGREDKLLIPKISFDIKTNYSTMEGKKIKSMMGALTVDKLSQRTGFTLDETGAKIESDGEVGVVFSEPAYEETPRPQQLIFDKPFFIVVKRKESANPYLVLWIANTELMR